MSAFKKIKHICLLIVGLTLLLCIPMSEATLAGFQEEPTKAKGYNERPTTGTDYAFAICCSGPNMDLPYYWDKSWRHNIGWSIPRFLARMSDSAYILESDYFPSLGQPYHNDTLYPVLGICNGGGTGFANEILKIADADINYANYDKDSNGVVDGFFFVIIDSTSSGSIGGCDHVPGCNYESDDTLADGTHVEVKGEYGVEVRIHGWHDWGGWRFTTVDYFTHICVHEWGHQFGLTELYCVECCPCGSQYAIGFSAMSNDHFDDRCSPYDPYSRSKLGWAEPTVVWDTVTNQAIADHMSSEEVYKLYCSSGHYFLVSNHTQDDYWEEKFPGWGLLIWQITPEGDNSTREEIPEVDVEGADGLWDFFWQYPDSMVRNDSTGKDSIDLGYLGVYRSFWNDSTKSCFDDTSSPNTRDYVKQGSTIKQTSYTGVWVRNIEGEGDDTMYADLFSPFIHWGPGEVQLSGDYTVDSGYTLTIEDKTDVLFATSDDQSSGYDTTRCELIVKGRLIAVGTHLVPPEPPQVPKYIIFKSSSQTPQPGDWYGIVVESGGSAHLQDVEIKDAYCGVYYNYATSSDNKVKDCVFSLGIRFTG